MRSRVVALLLLATTLTLPTFGQTVTNTINTFSSYSMYGVGELQTQGTALTRSMGGAGVALRSRTSINLLNPASYSIALRKGILFDFGAEAGAYFMSQDVAGGVTNTRYTNANFRDVALQIPVMAGLGIGFSVTPYSSVGYYMTTYDLTETNDFVEYTNEGYGDITEVKLGAGWEVTKGLSIGLAMQYYWGDLDRVFTTSITNIISPGTALSPVGTDTYSVSSIKGQLGVLWSPIFTQKRVLNLAATFDIGGDLSPDYTRQILGSGQTDGVYAQNDTEKMVLALPRQLVFGATYQTDKYLFAVDYSYQNWSSVNDGVEYTISGMEIAYADAGQIRMGVEYTPRRVDVRNYFNRVGYRAGLRYGGYQYTYGGSKIDQYAVTLGCGFPINMMGVSRIDVGLEWDRLGSRKNVYIDGASIGLVRQDAIKLTVGLSLFGDDYWFQRPQID